MTELMSCNYHEGSLGIIGDIVRPFGYSHFISSLDSLNKSKFINFSNSRELIIERDKEKNTCKIYGNIENDIERQKIKKTLKEKLIK